jgi:hypothetical protein
VESPCGDSILLLLVFPNWYVTLLNASSHYKDFGKMSPFRLIVLPFNGCSWWLGSCLSVPLRNLFAHSYSLVSSGPNFIDAERAYCSHDYFSHVFSHFDLCRGFPASGGSYLVLALDVRLMIILP